MIKNQALIDHPGNRVSDSQELTTRPRSVSYREKQGANCNGLILGGNCGGDPLWTMPSGNWWTWPGIAGSAGNRSGGTIIRSGVYNPGYDFVGGQTTQDQAITTVNDKIYGSYALVESRGNQDIYERTWSNCNCGAGSSNQQVNCYSNCNCNCNCNCCNCGSCFPAATPVAMADGSLRAIAGVRIGDKVMGESNRIATVVGLYRVKLGDRVLFEVNGTLRTTGDHLLRTASGWGAILPALYAERRFGQMFPVTVDEAGTVVPMINAILPPASIVKIGDGIPLVRGDGSLQPARSIIPMADVSADLDLFCLALDGARGFVAGGYVVDGFIRG